MCVCVCVLSEPHEDTVCSHTDLDNLVGARSEQVSSGGLIVHVNNAVLAVVEGGRGRSTGGHKGNTAEFTVRAESTKGRYTSTTERRLLLTPRQ